MSRSDEFVFSFMVPFVCTSVFFSDIFGIISVDGSGVLDKILFFLGGIVIGGVCL